MHQAEDRAASNGLEFFQARRHLLHRSYMGAARICNVHIGYCGKHEMRPYNTEHTTSGKLGISDKAELRNSSRQMRLCYLVDRVLMVAD